MTNIVQIDEPGRRAEICNAVLRALPDWFGIESAIVEYVEGCRAMPMWAALDGERPAGFVSLKAHNRYTFEVYVMGILKDYHRHGIGRRLIESCEAFCLRQGAEYLTVKTLDGSAPNADYARTREFYLAMGFRPLEVFPTLWDERNPCLFMAKRLT